MSKAREVPFNKAISLNWAIGLVSAATSIKSTRCKRTFLHLSLECWSQFKLVFCFIDILDGYPLLTSTTLYTCPRRKTSALDNTVAMMKTFLTTLVLLLSFTTSLQARPLPTRLVDMSLSELEAFFRYVSTPLSFPTNCTCFNLCLHRELDSYSAPYPVHDSRGRSKYFQQAKAGPQRLLPVAEGTEADNESLQTTPDIDG